VIYYIDIDETICKYENGKREYSLATPIPENIEAINKIHAAGNTVVYWTARGSQTGIDWTALTVNQLKEWGAQYTEVRLSKPHYDVFVCDKAINALDFFGSRNE